MTTCDKCGGEIIFRYIDGECKPIHLSGGCFGSGQYQPGPYQPKQKATIPIKHYSLRSFINPNALCPVCGQAVFFYQAPNGGRVYFDELGPPWPKHPCTNTSSPKTFLKTKTKNPEAESKKYKWQLEGWNPLLASEAERVHNDKFIKIKGTHKNKETVIYVTADLYFPFHSPILLKEEDKWSFNLSTISLSYATSHEGIEKRYQAYNSLQVAHIKKELENLLEKLKLLIDKFKSTNWNIKNSDYKRHLLSEIKYNIKAIYKIEESKKHDSIVILANKILEENHLLL